MFYMGRYENTYKKYVQEGEAAMKGLPVKKYIHLKKKPFQPQNLYQKIKQSLHIELFFGAVLGGLDKVLRSEVRHLSYHLSAWSCGAGRKNKHGRLKR